ncbi:hypothetical protein B0H99_10346 [Planomicrobium soli]|uniref:Uncharacterized protein n=1 Tax=Planomicrobium soli TaxID=1176648 RepID=A0A2P8H3X2_9BACL|nr:hypothetical protein [Planomicrobium soli]PSL40914.1 hypothetical protein B0H99_10346 [Planomicrobium soli]
MKEVIIKETDKLKGLKLRTAGRAANLFWLGFGEIIPITRRGETEEAPEFALHIQCAWRLSANFKIVVASQDLFVPRSDWAEDDEEFEWDIPGNNRFDERITDFLKVAAGTLFITEVQVDSLGGLKILMSNSFVLEVFPDSSEEWEFWRFFNRQQNSPHFVVSVNGVEYV